MAIIINGQSQEIDSSVSPGGSDVEPATEMVGGPTLLGDVISVKMDTTDHPAAGVKSLTVGFQLQNFKGEDLAVALDVELAVYENSARTMLASSAYLGEATVGEILDGGDGAALMVRTSSSGRFECELYCFQAQTVYLACSQSAGSPLLDCREIDEITFSEA
jgi:hypothetical protein